MTTCCDKPPAPWVSWGCRNLLVLCMWLPCQFITERLLSGAIPTTFTGAGSQGFLLDAWILPLDYTPVSDSNYLQGCLYLFLFIYLLDIKRRGLEHTQNMSIRVSPPCEQTYVCRQEGHALLFQPYHDLIQWAVFLSKPVIHLSEAGGRRLMLHYPLLTLN